MTIPVKNYYSTPSRGTSFSWKDSVPLAQGSQQLIKRIKISYSIASLLFSKFSCGPTEMIQTEVPQS